LNFFIVPVSTVVLSPQASYLFPTGADGIARTTKIQECEVDQTRCEVRLGWRIPPQQRNIKKLLRRLDLNSCRGAEIKAVSGVPNNFIRPLRKQPRTLSDRTSQSLFRDIGAPILLEHEPKMLKAVASPLRAEKVCDSFCNALACEPIGKSCNSFIREAKLQVNAVIVALNACDSEEVSER
jgi:hypothetical protein